MILTGAISEIKTLCDKNNIFEMNDDAIMVDVILEMLRETGCQLALECRLPHAIPENPITSFLP